MGRSDNTKDQNNTFLKSGRDLKRAELLRLRAVSDIGRAPAECGAAIVPVAPGRGPVVAFRSQRIVPEGGEGFRFVDDGWCGRAALRRGDAFDLMAEQSARAGGGGALFSAVQIGAGRDYAALAERVAAGGVKLSGTFSDEVGGGAGGGRDFMDAYIADCEALRRLHRAIGSGSAMVVRRVRPSVRGSRRSISQRALVDGVCLGGMTLSAVLGRFGWSVAGATLTPLRDALCAALDRMAEA